MLALNDKCAIKIIDDKYEMISEDDSSKAYMCSYSDKFNSCEIDKTGPISEIVL